MKDVTIIGGGPAGLYASFYAGLRGMDARVIDAQPELGGKMRLFPEKIIWDIGGVSPKPCAEITQDIIRQGLHFNPEIQLNEKVVHIEKLDQHHFNVSTESGASFASKSLIIAVGGGIITPKKLNINTTINVDHINLHYTVTNYEQFRHKTVLISGGGNSAMDWAKAIAPIAKEVILVYRKDSVTGHESTFKTLQHLNVTCLSNTSITGLHCNHQNQHRIHSVTLTHHVSEQQMDYEIDDIIVSHGYHRQIDLLQNTSIPLQLVDNQFIEGQGNSRTTVDGVYACGDILSHPSKIHLIAGAFNDAAHAVNCAKQYISPDEASHGIVSSHNPIFKDANAHFLPKRDVSSTPR